MEAIPRHRDAEDPLARIEARLERIERMLGRLEGLADAVPGMAGAAGDAFDEWAARHGDADDRVRALGHLVDRLTKPEVLRALTALVEQIEAAPGLIATALDALDQIAADAQARGIDLHVLARNAAEALRGIAILASRSDLRELASSGAFDAEAIGAMAQVARSLGEVQREAPVRVGMFGALSSMRDPDVQRAVGFALSVAKHFGHAMDARESAGEGNDRDE